MIVGAARAVEVFEVTLTESNAALALDEDFIVRATEAGRDVAKEAVGLGDAVRNWSDEVAFTAGAVDADPAE